MDSIQLQNLSKQFKISPVEILREEMEMLILEKISQSSISKHLIFKGGTALRLIYGSPRFSQDLDFNMKGKISEKDLKNVLNEIVIIDSQISIREVIDKRFTLFALLLVIARDLKQNFSIKIEISKKHYVLEKEDVLLLSAKSLISPFFPLIYSYSLNRILKEKMMAIKTRMAPRDYFDAWWVGQKLGLSVKLLKPKINKSQFKGELAQLLPSNLKIWPKEFLKKYE
jgi:predicted nucleotidyltransferase component of viral defense system